MEENSVWYLKVILKFECRQTDRLTESIVLKSYSGNHTIFIAILSRSTLNQNGSTF